MTTRYTRKNRIRAKIKGSAIRPRLAIFRSNKNIYLQAIDDEKKVTLASSSTLKTKQEGLGAVLAQKLSDKKITKIVFDRSGYQYHGNVKKIAEDLRKAGLEF